MAVLKIKNGVVETGSLGKLDVELDGRFAASHEIEVAKRVGPGALAAGGDVDLFHYLLDGDQISESLTHLVRLAVAQKAHQLNEKHLEPLLR